MTFDKKIKLPCIDLRHGMYIRHDVSVRNENNDVGFFCGENSKTRKILKDLIFKPLLSVL